MSASLNIKGYTSTENKEFQKHLNAVKFCIENELSFPKETSEFFKGKLEGDNLEEISTDYIIGYLENGIQVDLPIHGGTFEQIIKVSEIPKEVDKIIISYE